MYHHPHTAWNPLTAQGLPHLPNQPWLQLVYLSISIPLGTQCTTTSATRALFTLVGSMLRNYNALTLVQPTLKQIPIK